MIGRTIISLLAMLASTALAQNATPQPADGSPIARPAVPAEAPKKEGKADAKAADKGGLITITSSGGAEVYQKENLMIYHETVKFDHPAQSLLMTCDKLEVYRQDEPVVEPKPLEAEAAQGKKNEDKQPDIKEAIAIGNVTIIKKNADGTTTVGRGERALFSGIRRDVLLSGTPNKQPELDVGENTFLADTITLRENGKHLLGTNSKTRFKPKKSKPDN